MKKEIENKELFRLYHETKDIKIRDDIYFQNENLVYYFLNSFQTLENYEDILQEGRIGLLQAIENYDIDSNVQFSTFAAHYIKGYAKRCPSSFCSLYIPENLKWKYKKYKKIRQSGQNITSKELSKETGLDEKDIEYFNQFDNFLSLTSLDSPIECVDKTTSMINIIPDNKVDIEKDCFIQIINTQILDAIYEIFFDFNEIQFQILFFRLGINGHPKLMEKDIVNTMGIDSKFVRSTMAVYVRRQRSLRRNIRYRFSIPLNIKDTDVANFIYGR